jgi:hypothetical protein
VTLLADIRDRARAAGRELHAAIRLERRVRLAFERGQLPVDAYRDAIRAAAIAEERATQLALAVVELERLVSP